jgi:hypothetical protein
VSFQPIPVEAGKVDAAIVNRIQQAIANEFAALENPNSLVTPIVGTERLKSYAVQSSDKYVTVDASAVDVSIVLPPPGNQQVVTIVRIAGKVTVVNSNGGKFADGSTSIDVTTATQLLNSGKYWLVLL